MPKIIVVLKGIERGTVEGDSSGGILGPMLDSVIGDGAIAPVLEGARGDVLGLAQVRFPRAQDKWAGGIDGRRSGKRNA